MMTVHKVAGIDGPGYSDYLTSKGGEARRGDYYLGRGGHARENPETWHGRGAEETGLSGTVHRDDLLRIWEGRNPTTGELLVARGSTGDHVAGVDVTFSAPKSVSVLWALADRTSRTAVETAHEQAVLVALQHIEDHVPLARRRISDDEVVHEQVAGIIASRFRHHTSRLTADQHARGEALDPQLHDHVVIANMARRGGTGARWVAIDSRELFRAAAEGGAVYRTELAARLHQLGYGTVREGRYFEVEGISARLREVFSSRSEEVGAAVRRFVQDRGRQPTIAERNALIVLSREPKSVDHSPAFEQWTGRADAAGLATLPAPDPAADALPDRWAAVQAVVADLVDPTSPHHLTRDHAAVDERTFRTAVAEAAQGLVAGTDIEWLRRRVEMAPEIVRLPGGHWTTRSVIEAENEVLATAERRAAMPCDAPAEVVATPVQNARVPLSAEQQAAVQQLAASRLGLLTAPAGAGKGEVLRAVASARRASGKRVIAVAAAGETAQRFGKDINADLSLTVEALATATTTGRIVLSERDAVFVDEAGLLENSRWLTLVRLADRAFSLTATGDAAQLAPIQAGGLWPQLTTRLGAATLSENFRARDPDLLDAWADLRDGRAADAFARLDRKRQIVLSPTRSDSREAAVEQWNADRRAGAAQGRGPENYLLLATTTNIDVDLLNAAAQCRRLESAELGPAWIEVTAHDHAGRDRIERFHAGDRVVFSRQVRFGGWRPRVENGATGTVRHVDPDAQTLGVDLPDRHITLSGGQLGALRLGYAQHVYSAQGRTVDRAYVVTGGWQAGRETTYVALSRAREATHVYSDFSSLDLEVHDRAAALRELASRANETQAKVSAVGRLEQEQAVARQAAAGPRDAAHARTDQCRAAASPLLRAQPEERTQAERLAEEQARRERDRLVYEEVERQREHHRDRDLGREL
jgi:conjugative relaxase-like TrwC/TraI family protein